MSKDTDEFIRYLKDKIRQYRLEMLTDFYDTPKLLMGDGLRSFEVLSLFLPTLTVGPQGYPVPGGAFSESDNSLRYPVDERISRDVIVGLDTRIRNQNDCQVDGSEAIAEEQDEMWHAEDIALTMVGGSVGPSVLVNKDAFDSSRKAELVIYDVILNAGEEAVAYGNPLFTFTASGGSLTGQYTPFRLLYHYDPGSGHGSGTFMTLHFVNGKRMRCDTANKDILCEITLGHGAEQFLIHYNWRAFA